MAADFRPTALRAGPRPTGWLGVGSTAVILAGALTAGVTYVGPAGEAYSPLNHFISELGELSQSRLAPVYDVGIVLGGLGLGLFLLLLSRRLSGRFRPAMRAAAVLAAASGVLTALLPMDTEALHEIVSGVFFVTGWSVAAVFSAWLLAGTRPGFPRWLLIPGLGCIPVSAAFVAVYATYQPTDRFAPLLDRPAIWTVPLLEWAALISLLAWFVALSIVLIRLDRWPEA